jgi:hypothetical protein
MVLPLERRRIKRWYATFAITELGMTTRLMAEQTMVLPFKLTRIKTRHATSVMGWHYHSSQDGSKYGMLVLLKRGMLFLLERNRGMTTI